jgi:DNA-binding NarL/FixJ family response regulator
MGRRTTGRVAHRGRRIPGNGGEIANRGHFSDQEARKLTFPRCKVMIRVLIADDHPVVREGLKRIIREAPGIGVVEEACTGMETLQKAREKDYDVLLLDISMPDISGLEVLKQIRLERQKLPVLILSIYEEEQYAVRSLKAGAAGYLMKTCTPDELISAIHIASSGRKYVPSRLAEKLACYLDAAGEKPLHEVLSDREYEVLCMIARGKTMKEIAAGLFLSPKTVSTYRTRILEKMEMKSNAELMRYAMTHRLVE